MAKTPIKTWNTVAQDILYEKVELWMTEDNMLHVKRSYRFADANGLEIKDKAGTYEEAFAWKDVPADIQTALTFVDNFTKNKIAILENIPTVEGVVTDVSSTTLQAYSEAAVISEVIVEEPILKEAG